MQSAIYRKTWAEVGLQVDLVWYVIGLEPWTHRFSSGLDTVIRNTSTPVWNTIRKARDHLQCRYWSVPPGSRYRNRPILTADHVWRVTIINQSISLYFRQWAHNLGLRKQRYNNKTIVDSGQTRSVHNAWWLLASGHCRLAKFGWNR